MHNISAHFKQAFPNGLVSKREFQEIYAQQFPHGDANEVSVMFHTLFLMADAIGIYGGEFLTQSQTFTDILLSTSSYFQPKFDVLKISYFVLILNKNIAVLIALFWIWRNLCRLF